MSELRKNAIGIYKKTWLESWLIGIFSATLIALVLSLNYFVPSLWIITMPFIVLPIFFASLVSHLRLRHNEQLTFGKSLKEFTLFYRFPFNSSFSYLGSFLKSMVVFFGFLFLMSSSGFYVVSIFRPGLNNSLEAVQEVINEGKTITYELIDELLSMNGYALFVYLCVIIIPSFFFFCIALIYFITRNATGVYLRSNIKSNNPQFIKLVQNYVYSRYRMKMFKKYISLNWPLIVYFAIGFISTTVVMLTFSKSVLNIISLSLAIGIAATTFYLPFYYCNMEAIYLDSAPFYAQGLEYVTKRILNAMDRNNQNIEEQRRRYEEMLKKEQENQEQQEDVNNEKDPPTGS